MKPARKQRDDRLYRRWMAALALADMRQIDWAQQYGPPPGGWSDTHCREVAKGKRESKEVVEKMIEFIEAQEKKIVRQALAG